MGWILLAVGALFCAYVVVQLVRYHGSANWPTATAIVDSADVRRMQAGGGHHYCPVLKFTFVVWGSSYSGEWIGPPFHSPQDTADLIRQNTPVGAKLTVRYKAQDPRRNLLDMDDSLWDLGKPITLDLQ